jgi:hypothetical protein
MLGSALHYAFHYPRRLAGALIRDPAGVIEKLHDRLVQHREYREPVHAHEADADWERTLHDRLGCPWPCDAQAEFRATWPEVIAFVREQGVDVGPASFAGYNDGDSALVRAIWCLVRHLKPAQIVETGVAHGFSSRLTLEALARNGRGRLWSIDRPPLDPETRQRVGIAVPEPMRTDWQLLAGSSRRCLPALLARLGSIDLFIHDSLHTERNVRFELDSAWSALRPGGALVIDDIDSNGGFVSFCKAFSGFETLVCEAEPIRPDQRRFNQKGLFAIVLKQLHKPTGGRNALARAQAAA